MATARENDILIRLTKRPGDFTFSGGVLAEVVPANRASDELLAQILRQYLVEAKRTPRQDAEYCINQLVEIAIRALSPGINDPFTAMACIRWLGDGISQAARHEMPDSYRYDEDGILRVIAKVQTFAGLADAAFSSIRQHGAANASVALCLLETFAEIIPHVVRAGDLSVIEQHAEMTARDALAARPDVNEVADLEARLVHVRTELGKRMA